MEDLSAWEKENEAGVFPLALIQYHFEWESGSGQVLISSPASVGYQYSTVYKAGIV